jgi:hypothetical protein
MKTNNTQLLELYKQSGFLIESGVAHVEADDLDTGLNAKLAKFASLLQANSVPDDITKDAERYRYWKDKLISVDFDYQESGECVVILESPKSIKYGSDFDKITDAAIAAAPKGINHE